MDEEPEAAHRSAAHHRRYAVPPREPRIDFVPVLDRLFARLPAPEHVAAVEGAVEIHQPLGKPLEQAADFLELLDVAGDHLRGVLNLRAQCQLLVRLAPLGPSLRRYQLILVDQVAPDGIVGREVGDDALDERQSAVGFGEGEVLADHAMTIPATSSGCGIKPTTRLALSTTTIVAPKWLSSSPPVFVPLCPLRSSSLPTTP